VPAYTAPEEPSKTGHHIDEVLDHADVILIASNGAEFESVLRKFRHNQVVLDLVRMSSECQTCRHPRQDCMKELAGKHVLLIIENLAIPFDRRMWNIGTALRDFGADVSVICPMFGQDSEKETVLDDIAIYRYKNTFADGSVWGYLKEYATAFLKTFWLLHKLLLRRKRIHIIHVANPPDIFWPLALYLRLFGIKFIFDEHDLSPEAYLSRFSKEEGDGGLLLTIQKWFQRLSYRFSHAIISTNESYRAKALEVDPAYAEKTFVVRNGPDTRYFGPRPPNPALKSGHKYLAAYIGVMAIQDGVEHIIRAIDELVNRRHYRDLIVYLIGKGDDWPRLKQLTEELQLQDYVVFTGRIPDEPALEILSTADVCLAPDPPNPLNELSTMSKIMEYMALGKPIVSFDLKESRYSAGESAFYVKGNDVVAFADGILTLLEDPVGSKKMAEFGMARVEATLSWQKQSVSLLRAYQFVASRQR
jgi:glycosyltransferase involved in cell wall biosynthesis